MKGTAAGVRPRRRSRSKTPALERFIRCEEPRLREVIDDPIVRHLMASDGIGEEKLIEMMAVARDGIARR